MTCPLQDAYRENLKGVFAVMKAGASNAVFVTTTPYDIQVKGKEQFPAGINMSCVLEYNVISKEVAKEVGGVEISDLWQVVVACSPKPAGRLALVRYSWLASSASLLFATSTSTSKTSASTSRKRLVANTPVTTLVAPFRQRASTSSTRNLTRVASSTLRSVSPGTHNG
eukprot:SAG31_NODE_4427_length_3241_cov_1.992680_2_plen_169_part_00